jgi:hypothetical protein
VTEQPIDNRPPDCASAVADPQLLWPPNHKMVPIVIRGITDPDGDSVSVRVVSVRSNEQTDAVGDGATCPDAVLEAGQLQLRSERSGGGNGRTYVIRIEAEDQNGSTCQRDLTVCVPHDQRPEASPCASEDPAFDALSCGVAEPLAGSSTLGAARSLQFAIQSVSPSPSHGTVAIKFTVPSEQDVRVELIGVSGRRRVSRELGFLGAGEHTALVGDAGLPSGVYLLRLTSSSVALHRKVVVIH